MEAVWLIGLETDGGWLTGCRWFGLWFLVTAWVIRRKMAWLTAGYGVTQWWLWNGSLVDMA